MIRKRKSEFYAEAKSVCPDESRTHYRWISKAIIRYRNTKPFRHRATLTHEIRRNLSTNHVNIPFCYIKTSLKLKIDLYSQRTNGIICKCILELNFINCFSYYLHSNNFIITSFNSTDIS